MSLGVVFERGKLTDAMTKEMIRKVFFKLLGRYWSYFVTVTFRFLPGFIGATLSHHSRVQKQERTLPRGDPKRYESGRTGWCN